MNILVTGSAGFIGANLVLRLLRELTRGTVISLDNMNDYYDPKLKEYRLSLIEKAEEVMDTHVERVKKAYPAYFDTYSEIDTLVSYLKTIDNLYCVGRNGQHRYNNLDHSMMTSFEAVKCILNHNPDKSAIWNVNTEKEYHETKQ